MGRGAPGIRGRPWPSLDRGRSARGDGRELQAMVGNDAAAAPRPGEPGGHRTGHRRADGRAVRERRRTDDQGGGRNGPASRPAVAARARIVLPSAGDRRGPRRDGASRCVQRRRFVRRGRPRQAGSRRLPRGCAAARRRPGRRTRRRRFAQWPESRSRGRDDDGPRAQPIDPPGPRG